MSSFQSTGNAPAQRVPAWKRLGLKLKAASDEQSQSATLNPSTAAPLVPNHQRENPAGPGPTDTNAKRKSSGVPALDHSAKRAKRDVSQNQITPAQTPKKAKSVSFVTDTTQGAGSSAASHSIQPSTTTTKKKSTPTKNPKKPKKPVPATAKPIKKQGPVNLEPALAYLRQWHTSRDTWKFNKNHQTRLLEQVFADEHTIPAADIHIFYEYIRGLQGGVRLRLKELASGTKAQDMEQGPKGFSASGKETAERRQKEYENVIATFLEQPRTPGKRQFEEVDYVLRTSDIEMQRRVVKRMRCETVLDELSDSETSTTTTTTVASTGKGSTAASEIEDGVVGTDGEEDAFRLRLNDGPQQRTKRKRKVRTAVVDDDTSSESDSSSSSESEEDSDEDSSSNGSSSEDSDDESDDDAAQPQLQGKEDETSSSSSSSEESDSESDEEDD